MSAPRGASTVLRVVADNRKARHNYFIEDTLEAGIVLTGTEVKALRDGKATIAESYVSAEKGELFLINSYIPEYHGGNRFNHEPRRPRKLLVHRRELGRLQALQEQKGVALVPLKVYFTDRGRAKVEIAIARGKKLHDKRETDKKRDWDREKQRLLRDKG